MTTSSFILTGHGSLNDYFYRRQLSRDPGFQCGTLREVAVQLHCECVLYAGFTDLQGMSVCKHASYSEAYFARVNAHC